MNDRDFTLYGLSTMGLCLKAFLAQPVPSYTSQDARLRAHAFGLITMAKFIVRLPADILEEELPKIKLTLTDVCSFLIFIYHFHTGFLAGLLEF